jgi:hypothetical protein
MEGATSAQPLCPWCLHRGCRVYHCCLRGLYCMQCTCANLVHAAVLSTGACSAEMQRCLLHRTTTSGTAVLPASVRSTTVYCPIAQARTSSSTRCTPAAAPLRAAAPPPHAPARPRPSASPPVPPRQPQAPAPRAHAPAVAAGAAVPLLSPTAPQRQVLRVSSRKASMRLVAAL